MRQPSRVPWVVEQRQEARGRTAVATNIAGPRAPGSTPASCQRSPVRPASVNAASTVARSNPGPDMTHRAAVVVVGVREHVGHDQGDRRGAARARPRRARRTDRPRGGGGGRRARGRASRTRAAAPRCGPATIWTSREARPGARGRPRASRGRSPPPRPSAHRARSSRRCGPSRSRGRRRPRRVQQRGRQLQIARLAEQLAAARGPTRQRHRRRTIRVSRCRRVQHLLAPEQVEAHRDRLGEALVDDRPEPLRALVELVDREHVAPARAVERRAATQTGVGEQLGEGAARP